MKTEIPLLKNLSDRLNYALSLTGTKKADLARSISVKPQIIQFLCGSQTKSSRFTFEIAIALGLNTQWLTTGEGEIFIEDDPKQQFIKTYKPIPVLNNDNIREVFLYKKSFDNLIIKEWLPLKTEEKNFFAIEMTDTSMEPNFPRGSHIVIKICSKEKLNGRKFTFAYLLKFDTFVVRELIENESTKILKPINMELFKEINVTDDINFLGVVTDCFWHVRS
jgi:hypothetical protein